MTIANNAKTPRVLPLDARLDPLYASIVSQAPGRMRFRVVNPDRQPREIERIAKALKARLEIDRVRSNVTRGSITVFYTQEHLCFDEICALVRKLGVRFREIPQTHAMLARGKSEAAASLTDAVTALNQRVERVTGGSVDLRFLIPLSFSVLAVRQLLVKGWLLEAIPWYVLAWYAFDSFIKLLEFRLNREERAVQG